MPPAPIVLFVYKRLEHTKLTVEALKKNELAMQSPLIVFSDGAKSPDVEKKVNQVRKYLHSTQGFKSIEIIERTHNLGLANSIIDGVTKVVNKYGSIIVLEDDLVTAPFFLTYMNDALTYYEDEKQVISIHGYNYPIENMPESFFLRGADCWGWATWKRGWDLFERDGKKLLAEIEKKKLTHRFNFFGSYPYLQMLKKQIAGKNDSWAIRWYASAFLKNKLTLYPGTSLVKNIGCDNSGENCNSSEVYSSEVLERGVDVGDVRVSENKEVLLKITKWLQNSRPGLISRIINKIVATVN